MRGRSARGVLKAAAVAFAAMLLGASAGQSEVERSLFTGSITPGGPPLVATMSAPGESATVTFPGSSGQRVALDITNGTFSGSGEFCVADIRILNPDQSVLYQTNFSGLQFPKCPKLPGNWWTDVLVLAQTGTFTIQYIPRNAGTGSVTMTLYDVPADTTASLSFGVGTLLSTTVPGQNFRPTFLGSSGQRISLNITNGNFPGSGEFCVSSVQILKPDQTVFYQTNPGAVQFPSCPKLPGNWWTDVLTLPTAGTYTIVYNPSGQATGSLTFTVYDVPPDPSPTLTIGGNPVTITTTVPGQNFRPVFSGVAGQPVNIVINNGNFPGSGEFCVASVSVLKPDQTILYQTNPGAVQFPSCPKLPGDWTIPTQVLPVAGTYTIVYNPFGTPTGHLTFAITASAFQPPEQTFGTDADGKGTHGDSASATRNDPVNTLTGAFTASLDDLSLPGTGVPFSWSRSYTSADATVGRLGPAWTDSYSASLAVQANGDVRLHGEDGQQLFYTKQANGSFVGDAGARSVLSAVAGGYELVRRDQVRYLFDANGRLSSMLDRNGQGVTLAYDGAGLLTSVTDAAGRQATVSYNASSLVSGVSLPDGRSVAYGYTGGRLSSFTDVRGKVWSYTYDAGGRLAAIVDPLNHAQVANVYDAVSGRVSSQTDAVGKTTTFAWDATNQIATVTDANGSVWKDDYDAAVLKKRIDALSNETTFVHDADLNDTSVTGPTSQTTTMTYDTAGNLLTATAPPSLGGVQKTFVYNAKNDPTSVTDARGKVTAYGYDAAGNNTSVTQDATPVGSYTYDAQGRVLTFTDGNSKTTTYTYEANGNTESVTDPLGNKTTYTYDAAGRVLTRVDPKGNVAGCGCASQFTWTYTYNPAGQLLTETDPLGNTTTHTYDDAGNELTVTDANLKTTTYAYDNANRLLSVTAPDTGVTSYTYDNVGNRLTETDPLGHVTTHAYDANNRLASTTTASGAKTTFFYDANGNLTKQVEPRGNVGGGVNPDDYATTFTYDAAGRLLTETDPLGHVTTHTYDAVGNELTVVDPNSKTTTSTYDGRNRLSTVTAPDTGVTTYTYDPVGNKLTEKDPRNNITTFAYDDANRLASVTKPSGGKTTYGYDANGNQTSMVEPRGNVAGCGCAAQFTWTYAFDRANRRLSETSPLGHVTSFAYDAVGNQTSLTDANTHQTAYTYDSVNRLKTVIAADLGVTANTYDLAGNLVQRKDARNNVTTYGYDVDNRRTSVTSPLAKVWTTAYDAAGNVLSTVDANGNQTPTGGDGTTTYTYDRAGRLTGVDYSDATPDVTFTYDNAGNRLSMLDGPVPESRTYDAVNRLSSVTRGTDVFSYAYDLAGNLTSRTYPGGAATTYTYDTDNRLGTAVNASLTTSYSYDAAGNPLQTTLPAANGFVETRVYDASGRLNEVKNQKGSTVLSRFVVSRDPVGNPTQVDRTGSLVQTQTYSYDVSDRIQTVCFATSCTPTSPNRIAWTYDLVGNRLTETRSTGTTSYTYNAGDQLQTAGSTGYTYDANGNQLSAGSQTMSWDLASRLKTHAAGTTTTTYSYDGDGKRLQASTGTQASKKTNFLWDVNYGLPQLALERDGNNALQRQYIYGKQRIRQSAGTPSYYHYDGLDSVTNLTSSSGATQWTWSYEPYGSIRTETKANGNQPANMVKFTGEYLDPTGLYHLRARQYDPVVGRFLGLDPLEPPPVKAAISEYQYAEDRPTVFIDPSGLGILPSGDGVGSAAFAVSTDGFVWSSKDRVATGEFGFYRVVAFARARVAPRYLTVLETRRSDAGLRVFIPDVGGIYDPNLFRHFMGVYSGLKRRYDLRSDRRLTDSIVFPIFASPLPRYDRRYERRLTFSDDIKPKGRAERCRPGTGSMYYATTTIVNTQELGIAGWDLQVELTDLGPFRIGKAVGATGYWPLVSALVCDVLQGPGAVDTPKRP